MAEGIAWALGAMGVCPALGSCFCLEPPALLGAPPVSGEWAPLAQSFPLALGYVGDHGPLALPRGEWGQPQPRTLQLQSEVCWVLWLRLSSCT